MRIAITGASGMIGSRTCDELIYQGHNVLGVDDLSRGRTENLEGVADSPLFRFEEMDVTDRQRFAALLRAWRPDVLVNMAAKVGGIHFNRENQVEMFAENLIRRIYPLLAASDVGIHRVLQFSTACILPHDAEIPTPEIPTWTGECESTNRGYGISSRFGEEAGRFIVEKGGVAEAVIVRPWNAYDPERDYDDEESSHVIPALLKRCAEAREDEDILVFGSGNQKRAFLDARDAAEAIADLCVCEIPEPVMTVNVGHEEQVSIRSLVEIIRDVLGKSNLPIFDLSYPDGYAERAADTTRLSLLIGWAPPKRSLREGIEEYARVKGYIS